MVHDRCAACARNARAFLQTYTNSKSIEQMHRGCIVLAISSMFGHCSSTIQRPSVFCCHTSLGTAGEGSMLGWHVD